MNSQFQRHVHRQLDTSNWSTNGSTISAPNNFAFDPSNGVISINASGNASFTAAEAAGTTYDGATPKLSASKAAAPGAHTLYLSIFDQGDQVLDSAVFVDGLSVGSFPTRRRNAFPERRRSIST